MHEIIVENVGNVYCGDDEDEARKRYESYAGVYKPWGLYYYADVLWIEDEDIRQEYNDPGRSPKDREGYIPTDE